MRRRGEENLHNPAATYTTCFPLHERGHEGSCQKRRKSWQKIRVDLQNRGRKHGGLDKMAVPENIVHSFLTSASV